MNVTAVERAARQGHLYPAVILHGCHQTDRRQAALNLAQILLCDKAPESRPCGTCRHCLRVEWPDPSLETLHPDFRVLERDLKTSTSVEATKEFLQLAQRAPFEARGQVFGIDRAETLTGEAANALLKTLEEPPSRTPRNFLLLSPSQFDLLPTIRSRSLAVFLGMGGGVDREALEPFVEAFSAGMKAYAESRSSVHLMAAAQRLAVVGDWKDPRAAQPWTLAAAAVKETLQDMPETLSRAKLLALAEELLGAWRLRLRGIQAQRILEGLFVRHLCDGDIRKSL